MTPPSDAASTSVAPAPSPAVPKPPLPGLAPASASPPPAAPEHRTLAYQALIGGLLAVGLVSGYSYLLAKLPGSVDLLFLVLVMFGGGGGILFAVREGDLVAPRFHRARSDPAAPDVPQYSIRLGWVGDALFGVAGAATIFLLIPGLSENAATTMQEMRARDWNETTGLEVAQRIAALEGEVRERRLLATTIEKEPLPPNGEPEPNRFGTHKPEELRRVAREKSDEITRLKAQNPYAAGSPDPGANGRSGTDFIELIAVALIGGFGGRAVLQRASAQLLHQKVEKVEAQLRDQTARIDQTIEHTRANSEALELAALQLNPLLPQPDPVVLEQVLARATEAGRLRVLDYTSNRLRDERGRVAPAAAALLNSLLKVGTTPRHPVLGCLGEAYGYLGDRTRAVELLDAAIEFIKDDPAAGEQLKAYQVLREKFGTPRPATPKATASLPKKG